MLTIVTGGQTGVDRAALDGALSFGIRGAALEFCSATAGCWRTNGATGGNRAYATAKSYLDTES